MFGGKKNTTIDGGRNHTYGIDEQGKMYIYDLGRNQMVYYGDPGKGFVETAGLQDRGHRLAFEGDKRPTGKAPAANTDTGSYVAAPTYAPTVDPSYQALLQQQAEQRAREAADTAEAQRIRDGILGRRKSVEDMLSEILGNIDSQLREGKGNREASFNRDVQDLVSSLDGSIPDIENAFSALGLSNSTYKADRVQDTRDAYERSYVDTERQKKEDLAAMQQKATGEKSKWRGEANNILDTIGTFQDIKPTHNDLNRLRGADLDSKKAINSLKSSKEAYQPGSSALKAITKLDGDYDFSKTLDSFNSLASASNPASGAVGDGKSAGAGRLSADDKKNKKKTEVQINNPVGAASA